MNSLAYHLLQETDYLGLLREGHEVTADVIIEAIEQMSTLDKWATLGKMRKGYCFDTSRGPYQELKIMFRFRDDLVHDKVVSFSDERAKRRHNNKLPDPAVGFLDLRHSTYAADTYWDMITGIHELIGIGTDEFHRHYNMKPWFDETFEKQVRQTAEAYASLVPLG